VNRFIARAASRCAKVRVGWGQLGSRFGAFEIKSQAIALNRSKPNLKFVENPERCRNCDRDPDAETVKIIALLATRYTKWRCLTIPELFFSRLGIVSFHRLWYPIFTEERNTIFVSGVRRHQQFFNNIHGATHQF
jgi:hypothetical protein